MFYKLVFIIVAISFFSFNCKGADKNMDKKGKETAEMHRRASQQTKKGSIYKYNDGSGNLYIISSNKIIYDPIPKHMTSTGFTDNGKRINKEITKDQYSKIAGEYKKLFENKKIHINKRLMGSGILN